MPRLLVVDDDLSMLNLLATVLRGEGCAVVPLAGAAAAVEELRRQDCDLVLTDIRMEGMDGLQLLREARALRPCTPVIMLTGHGTVETAVEAMKSGAFDYCTKPFKVDDLLATVRRALQYRAVLVENAGLRAQLDARLRMPSLIAESPAMRHISELIGRVAASDAAVLIQGDSGTGKEVVARAIHDEGPRRTGPLVPINCAALPEPLLESEMFGHVRGAFTGATSDKIGLFEAAAGGSIFLDEIGAMPAGIQAKLLRVLQDKTIRKVGGTSSFPVDVRVIAATNQPLEGLIASGRFREDLYYRISVIPIRIPPLRERREDIIPLAAYFLRRERPAGAAVPKLSAEAQAALESYEWPGNVRELENAVRYALAFLRGDTITLDLLPARIVDSAPAAPRAGGEAPAEAPRSIAAAH